MVVKVSPKITGKVVGNRRFLWFVAAQDGLIIKLLRMVSPGILQRPQADHHLRRLEKIFETESQGR